MMFVHSSQPTFTFLFHLARSRSIVSLMLMDVESTVPEREMTLASTDIKASGSDMLLRFAIVDGLVVDYPNTKVIYF